MAVILQKLLSTADDFISHPASNTKTTLPGHSENIFDNYLGHNFRVLTNYDYFQENCKYQTFNYSIKCQGGQRAETSKLIYRAN